MNKKLSNIYLHIKLAKKRTLLSGNLLIQILFALSKVHCDDIEMLDTQSNRASECEWEGELN